MPYSKKPRFNLRFILQETGLKADTIRAWERRYHLPQPARSSGGQRLYSEYDLQTILWLLKRQDEGMRIGQASSYWKELSDDGTDPLSIEEETEEATILPLTTTGNISLEDLQSMWLEYSLLFDGRNAEQILTQAFARYPVQAVCEELIMPGLIKVGELWLEGEITVQQEHFTSEIASRELNALISAAPNPVHKQKILLGNPPGEDHVIGLLMMTLLLKNRGWPTIYLGANVPVRDLLNTINGSKVDLAIMNASRLVTSAALLEAMQLLAKNGTPVAFSGWIFSQSENLYKKFPGFYLGDDLGKAVNRVEEFLNNPEPIPALEQSISDGRLINRLWDIEPQLSKSISDSMMAEGQEFEPNLIIKAGRDLIADITAALSLGNIQYAFINLEWVSKLLTHRNSTETVLQTFISTFTESLEKILGSEAKVIIQALENFSNTNKSE